MEHGTTTITLSIPTEMKGFFVELAQNGYNRSFLMLKMAKILKELYDRREDVPGGLHGSVDLLLKNVREDNSNPMNEGAS
jgi:hypothetical protein